MIFIWLGTPIKHYQAVRCELATMAEGPDETIAAWLVCMTECPIEECRGRNGRPRWL